MYIPKPRTRVYTAKQIDYVRRHPYLHRTGQLERMLAENERINKEQQDEANNLLDTIFSSV